MRAELLGLLRPCYARVEPWLQAGRYVGAVMSGLQMRNRWTIAEYVGDRTPDKTQRLLNRASWDTQAPAPSRPDQPPPADPGMIPLTVPEIKRLLGQPPPPGAARR